jgi:hypothetical protein
MNRNIMYYINYGGLPPAVAAAGGTTGGAEVLSLWVACCNQFGSTA